MAGKALKSGVPWGNTGVPSGLKTSNGPKNRPSAPTPPWLGTKFSSAKNWTVLGSFGSAFWTLGINLGISVTPAFFKMALCRAVSCVVSCEAFS